jgi:hypothetical protein
MADHNPSSQTSSAGVPWKAQKSPASASPSKVSDTAAYTKEDFVHYGSLLVDSWCAYGVPFSCLFATSSNLRGLTQWFFRECSSVSESDKPDAKWCLEAGL